MLKIPPMAQTGWICGRHLKALWTKGLPEAETSILEGSIWENPTHAVFLNFQKCFC